MMRRHLITIVAGATLLAPAALAAQSLAARMNDAPADATVLFTFESKPGVCGDGESIRYIRDGRENTMHFNSRRGYSNRGGWDSMRDCVEGPIELELTREHGRIIDANFRVGGEPRTGGVDLGAIEPGSATAFLLSVDALSRANRNSADRMIVATTLANTESWPALLEAARAQQLPERTRSSAVFWLAQAAGDRATEGLRSIVGDDSDEIEVRKQAVFAISQIRTDASIDQLIDIARTNSEPEIRRSAIFWLGQSGSPRAIAFFEEVLRG